MLQFHQIHQMYSASVLWSHPRRSIQNICLPARQYSLCTVLPEDHPYQYHRNNSHLPAVPVIPASSLSRSSSLFDVDELFFDVLDVPGSLIPQETMLIINNTARAPVSAPLKKLFLFFML